MTKKNKSKKSKKKLAIQFTIGEARTAFAILATLDPSEYGDNDMKAIIHKSKSIYDGFYDSNDILHSYDTISIAD